MCLAIPAQIIALLEDEHATVDIGGIKKNISTALVPHLAIGDYVIVHVGYALTKLNEDEAKQTLALFESLGALQ